MKEKIKLMLKVYRDRLEKAQRLPIDYVLCIQTEAQIAILESLYIFFMQEEGRGLTQRPPDAAYICHKCGEPYGKPHREDCALA